MREAGYQGLFIGVWLGVAMPVFAEASTPAESVVADQAEQRNQFIALLRSARQGDASAQWQVAATYIRLGEYAPAMPLLNAAGEAGHPDACSLLGALHEDGRGVSKDLQQAMQWYRRAAEKGDAVAMAALARLLPAGDPQAAEMLRRAATAGNADAQYALGLELAKKGEGALFVESHLLFSKAATQGHLGAQVALALQFLDGKATKVDRKAAQEWLEKAARAKDPVANFLLGRLFLQGDKPQTEKARFAFTQAAALGHREAQYQLGLVLAESDSGNNRKDAIRWLDAAQKAGHLAAANRLGELLRGAGAGQQELARARGLFLHAAEQGNVDAMYNFAQMQHEGLGGEKDAFEALKWFGRAADGKHERAIEVVENLLSNSIKTSSLGLKGFWQ